MSARRNRILALLVGVLALLVYLELEREQPPPLRPLTRLDPDAIRNIRIGDRHGRDIRLQRRGSLWYLQQPFAIAADTPRLRKLTQIAHTPVFRTLQATPERLPAFGLAPPAVSLWLDATRIDFGATEPIDFRRYVRLGDQVLLIADGFQHHLLAPAEALVSTHLLPSGAAIREATLDGQPLPRTAFTGIERLRATRVERRKPGTTPGQPLEIRLAGADAPLRFLIAGGGGVWIRPDLGLEYRLAPPLLPRATVPQ